MKKIAVILVAVVVIFASMPLNCYAVDEKISEADWSALWQTEKTNQSLVALTPGSDEGQMNFAWISSIADLEPMFKIGLNADLSDAQSVEVESSLTVMMSRTNKVTASGLSPKTTYYYSYTVNGEWQETESFETAGTDSLSALFVTDPQMGRSGDSSDDNVLISDSYGWYSTLYTALSSNSDISFILSAGDQINEAYSSKQYNSLLAAPMLRNVPIAAAIGNHEFEFPLYRYHFNNPNEYKDGRLNSLAGYSYYFTNSDVLFIVLDSNNNFSVDNESFINEAVSSNPDAQWRVVMMHHSIYSSNSGEDGSARRFLYAPLFDKYDIDLVLSGHDHAYSRSFALQDFEISDGGVVYIEEGSASGSKLGNPADVLPSFIASSPDIDSPTYTVLDFDSDSIAIKSYRTDTNEVFDEYTIGSSVHSEEVPAVSSLFTRIFNIIIAEIKDIFN